MTLEQVADTYRRDSVQDNWMRKLCVRMMSPWLKQSHLGLEIGCSDGFMSAMLADRIKLLTVVEATATFADALDARGLGNVEVHRGMVESFVPEQMFDRIFATWVLTHVIDADSLLRTLSRWLKPDGLLFVAVPNVRVLSRQLARQMNLIEDLFALTDNDRAHGHVRAFDRQRLDALLRQTGFETVFECGLMLKPLADFQMDQLYASEILTDEHVEGLLRLGFEHPDLCSALFSVCRAVHD